MARLTMGTQPLPAVGWGGLRRLSLGHLREAVKGEVLQGALVTPAWQPGSRPRETGV